MRDRLERLDLAPPQRLSLSSLIVRVSLAAPAVLLWWGGWCEEVCRIGVMLLLMGGRGGEGGVGPFGCCFPGRGSMSGGGIFGGLGMV